MSEKANKAIEKPRSKARLWLENYWYHYKWVTLIVAFCLIVGIICIAQAVQNNSYDSYIMYAGPRQLSHKEVLDIEKDFCSVVEDKDGDGKVNLAIRELFIMSPEEIASVEEGYEANYALISDNMKVFDQEILSGEATICLLSPFLYERVKEADGFLPIGEYVGDAEVEYVDEYGVKLNSTAFGKLAGLSALPDDTVLCVRRVSTIASIFDKKQTEKNHALNIETVKRIFEMN